MRTTADGLRRMAAIVRVLEERGEDLRELRVGLVVYLRRIAYGQLLPEVVVRYAESPAVLRRISELALPDQRRLLADERPIELLVPTATGGTEIVRVSPARLTRAQIGQVFDGAKIRTPGEQAAIVGAGADASPTRRRAKVRVDRRTRELRVGKARVPIAAVLQALADAAGHQGEIGDVTHGAVGRRDADGAGAGPDAGRVQRDAARRTRVRPPRDPDVADLIFARPPRRREVRR